MNSKIKQFFEINRPINTSVFSICFIVLLILGQNVRFFLPKILHPFHSFLDTVIVLLPLVYFFALIYTKRLIDLTQKYSPKRIFLSLCLFMALTVVIVTYTTSLVGEIYIAMKTVGSVEPELHNKLGSMIPLEILVGAPLVILSFFLLFKKGK